MTYGQKTETSSAEKTHHISTTLNMSLLAVIPPARSASPELPELPELPSLPEPPPKPQPPNPQPPKPPKPPKPPPKPQPPEYIIFNTLLARTPSCIPASAAYTSRPTARTRQGPVALYQSLYDVERRIFKRLGEHPNLVKVTDMDEHGIWMERA